MVLVASILAVSIFCNGNFGYLQTLFITFAAAAPKAAIAPPPSLMDLDVKPTEDFQGSGSIFLCLSVHWLTYFVHRWSRPALWSAMIVIGYIVC